ncbi:MAG: hypothetical protein JXA44_13230 [Methanospirillaceae archaeon]|nr:hypothetical protein [Methanospirillaceae archaeon]
MKFVIKNWTRDSTPINTAVRYGKLHEYFKGKLESYNTAVIEAGLLSKAICKSSLQQEYTVSRGLGPYDVNKVKVALNERQITGISPILDDKGFISVTYQNEISLGYAEPDEMGEIYLFSSTLQKGDNALFIGDETTLSKRKEGEILLQKGSRYYITGEKTYIPDSGILIHLIDIVFIKGSNEEL